MNAEVTFVVPGLPATFATAGEKSWKSRLTVDTATPSMGGDEAGLTARFTLPTLAPKGNPLDIDNLCEPLFSILVNRIGWFRCARQNIRWWRASKEEGPDHGCRLCITSDPGPILDTRPSLITGVYVGPLPLNAKAPEVAKWSRILLGEQAQFPMTKALSCYLGFGSGRINIGDIATGVVKSFIDCLYPIWGGAAGSPSDHKIDELTVAKTVQGVAPDSVLLRLWPLERVVSTSPRGRLSPYIPAGRGEEPPVSEDVQRSRPWEPITNPCRPGSAKYIVYEAALAGWSLEQVHRELDASKPGSSRNLSDYISDLRSENKLDVGHDGRVLWCRGRINPAHGDPSQV
jgi:hypothetical protein